jgi:hypothetical protein
MSPRKRTSKKHRYNLVNPSHRDSIAPAELDLLHTRALLAVRNFTHYEGGDQARALMERLFKDYKKYKSEVHKRIVEAFKRIRENSKDEKIEEKIKQAKIEINEIAKKVW